MPLAKEQKEYTIEDIYALPEGKRAELIDGIIYDMAPPKRLHQEYSAELMTRIRNYIRGKNGNCKTYAAPFAVRLNANDRNYVEPDISVICDKEKLSEDGCEGAPDWIIEIVSPSSVKMDYFIKLFKYRTAGVREYWIVDIRIGRILVYDFDNDDMREYTTSDQVPAGIYQGDLQIDFSEFPIS